MNPTRTVAVLTTVEEQTKLILAAASTCRRTGTHPRLSKKQLSMQVWNVDNSELYAPQDLMVNVFHVRDRTYKFVILYGTDNRTDIPHQSMVMNKFGEHWQIILFLTGGKQKIEYSDLSELRRILRNSAFLDHDAPELCKSCGSETTGRSYCDNCSEGLALCQSYVADGMTSHAAAVKAGIKDPNY